MQNFILQKSRFAQAIVKRLGNINGTISVKRGRPVVNMLLNISNTLGWRSNLSLVKVVIVYLSRCCQVYRAQSAKGLCLQLKIASVLLQQSMGGYKVPNVSLLGQRQSRNGQGLPRNWIPAIHRAHLRRGDAKYFKLWMTLFAIYRVLDFPGKLNLSSITSPHGKDFSFLLGEFSSFICGPFRKWLLKLVKGDKLVMLKGLSGDQLGAAKKLTVVPFIISSSSPSIRRAKGVETVPLSTSPAGILQSVLVWYRPENDQLRECLFNYAKMTNNIWLINRMEDWRKKIPRGLFSESIPGTLGKLACLDESAGKIRVVAMVDNWTQWLLHPLFSALSALLSRIPMDGTTDQQAPYDRLWGRCPDGPFYCYDLSSATDRLPLVFQQALLSAFFGSWFATLWGQLLVGRPYLHMDDDGGRAEYPIPVPLYYEVGQPMGAKSSFHMMALFHHAIVQWAAFRCGWQSWFENYAIVGDDVVIADKLVAAEYLNIMQSLGVAVGLHKSLVSSRPPKSTRANHGLCSEFIKKTYYSKRHGSPAINVSALPIPQWYMATQVLASAIDLAKSYDLSVSQYLTLWGFGYRVKGNLSAPLSKMSTRCRHRILSYFSPKGVKPLSFSEWISMKSITDRYSLTSGKLNRVISRLLVEDTRLILQTLESDSWSQLIGVVKKFTTVNRDREYYGTTTRKMDRIHEFEDLVTFYDSLKWGYTKWVELSEDGVNIEYHNEFVTDIKLALHRKEVNDVQYVLDSLTELVYRPAFMDVLISIRDIRNKCEELIESCENIGLSDAQDLADLLDSLQSEISSLSQVLSGLPLPKELYRKVDGDIRKVESRLVKSWERYISVARSTKS